MCLLLFSYKNHPGYKLIAAANRDEFYERPALPAHNWKDNPVLYAGKDLKGCGTWLGITKTGRFAAITNYRDMSKIKRDAPTRGKLVVDFLINNFTPENYAKQLIKTADNFNGYNLIFGTIDELFYFSNQTKKLEKLTSGIHGLSNHLLDTPWPKVEKSKKEFSAILSEKNPPKEKLFNLLSDSEIFPDDKLPDTGLEISLERMVSPIFIKSEVYGTRSSTLIFIDNKNNVTFIERSFNQKNKKPEDSQFNFKIKKL